MSLPLSTIPQIDDFLVRKTLGGPKRFRPKAREELALETEQYKAQLEKAQSTIRKLQTDQLHSAAKQRALSEKLAALILGQGGKVSEIGDEGDAAAAGSYGAEGVYYEGDGRGFTGEGKDGSSPSAGPRALSSRPGSASTSRAGSASRRDREAHMQASVGAEGRGAAAGYGTINTVSHMLEGGSTAYLGGGPSNGTSSLPAIPQAQRRGAPGHTGPLGAAGGGGNSAYAGWATSSGSAAGAITSGAAGGQYEWEESLHAAEGRRSRVAGATGRDGRTYAAYSSGTAPPAATSAAGIGMPALDQGELETRLVEQAAVIETQKRELDGLYMEVEKLLAVERESRKLAERYVEARNAVSTVQAGLDTLTQEHAAVSVKRGGKTGGKEGQVVLSDVAACLVSPSLHLFFISSASLLHLFCISFLSLLCLFP